MKKKKKKVKWLTEAAIAEILQQQQETVGIVGEYIQSIPLTTENTTQSEFCANFAMKHIFVNIRHSYQDGIVLSQGLINNPQYYISPALAHAQRTAQEFLIDLAYIMSDLKHRQGNEYRRYLKFVVDKEKEESGKSSLSEDNYNGMFPPHLNLEPKSRFQWSHTKPTKKIDKGLKLYKIESPDFADWRFDFHKMLSSTAHGNENTMHMFTQTPEENRPKLRADLTVSIPYFDTVLVSALNCYIKFYLGQNNDCRKIVKSMFPDKEN